MYDPAELNLKYQVMSVCEDWGKYKQIAIIPAKTMPSTQDGVKANIVLVLRRHTYFNAEINDLLKPYCA